ncbi:hypothetical protein E3U23_03005 [Erythrobacter litoralis]|uniref:hypothetical protein n=1 Tax=Erythrobacter litoralis TaxID=39960 RepID=UPI002435AD6F|nr:hypothetical protein [Erythrobacter litoralis]MDG6078157.1 hypothetical protein [Erythrobacter litoralis]
MIELGRFFVTALAVAIAIPASFLMASLFTGETFSIEAFFAVGAISFVLAIIGGLIFGLPTLWFLRRQGWAREMGIVTSIGTLVGAFGGILLSAGFWQGNLEVILAGLWAWAVMGAIAGFVASPVWLWLHQSEAGLVND